MALEKLITLSICVSAVVAFEWGGYGGEFHHAKPYHFGYVAKGPGGESHHGESGVGGKAVRGSYGYTDANGMYREVKYVADHGGFRPEIKTNEPGTVSKDSAHVKMHSSAHPYFGVGMHGDSWHGYGGSHHGGEHHAPYGYSKLW
ncbi:cuticle protein 10.9-like [Parasteatoda tepidariorum]|uniref:cuticle protein 10.9-like n=1 Tax=Parasteatoda tepidariorum TaxID=114398 RepID=UPI00077FD1AB|nr:cuticle protein 10.9-like [Parasteatoda tepidariorum]